MTRGPGRLPTGGRIDRSATLRMFFDGAALEAHPGDTVASALLANGIRVVGRSFKYHRPRGIVAAGAEEPNALVTLGRHRNTQPNTLATCREAADGLEAFSQNCWPSLRFDIGAVNSLAAPLIPAGFYYKTFMGFGGGTRAWMFFERFIRKAAGIGRASNEPDGDHYEKVNGFCDVLVIGGGPAGMVAALAAAEARAKVFLVEQDFMLGGSLLSEPVGGETDRTLSELCEAVMRSPRITVLTRTTVFGAYDCGVFGLVEHVADDGSPEGSGRLRERYWLLRSKSAVLASGALERPIVFEGNDLPGVMLAGSVRTYLNRFGVIAGRKAIILQNNDTGIATALDLARAGAQVTVVDMREALSEKAMGAMRHAGVECLTGCGIVKAVGGHRVKRVAVGRIDATGLCEGEGRMIDCDLVAVAGGWTPVVHLQAHLSKPAYSSSLYAHPASDEADRNLFVAGACSGPGSLSQTLASGAAKGHRAAVAASFSGPEAVLPLTGSFAEADWHPENSGGWKCIGARTRLGKAFVDHQHDVTLADIDLSHREGYVSIEHLKRYTTAGMGVDQGKSSSLNSARRLAELERRTVSELGTTGFRPPYTPVTFGALAGSSYGRHFRPTRLSPLHRSHEQAGAVMIEAGDWLRPYYFPRDGEGLAEASAREAGHVREKVGMVDVSTLGKIAVQGPDAAEFIDRVYANRMKSLKVGQIRYGIMLREDGFILDDGTVACLGESDFFLTTTTTGVSRVFSHLEYLLDTAWPDLKAEVTSVTDQWGAIALSGRHSREILQSLAPGQDLSSAALPNMRFTVLELAGIPVRVHRMSYSGELAYEIYVPSDLSETVWGALLVAGAAHGIVPYGTEAMSVLRIEKGHIAGGEIDGRTTLRDVGLDGLTKGKHSFVGAVLEGRERLVDPLRPTLVGLWSRTNPMRAGALLYGKDKRSTGHGDGHVSSSAYSPALEGYVALAFLSGGADRHGEMIRCVNHLQDENLLVEVVSPKFFDPDGQRQNG